MNKKKSIINSLSCLKYIVKPMPISFSTSVSCLGSLPRANTPIFLKQQLNFILSFTFTISRNFEDLLFFFDFLKSDCFSTSISISSLGWISLMWAFSLSRLIPFSNSNALSLIEFTCGKRGSRFIYSSFISIGILISNYSI